MIEYKSREYYEQRALLYAEEYGVINYKILNNKLYYKEVYLNEGTYQITVDLDNMKEYRTKKADVV